ncbi:MAG: gliding motility-associated C-terminal domain-containing protein [Flavobacteriales bacterium]|nr:gliding motility-associated C-terminal domain-containing protein [Flavobacteriales bacterium]
MCVGAGVFAQGNFGPGAGPSQQSGGGTCFNAGGSALGGGGQQIDACTGYFYDSGGSGGNYADGEHITVTICPAAGPGSGPSTSVAFLQWDVAGLVVLTDYLEIYDGTSTGGLPIAVGSNLVSLAGQTFTSTHPSGCLTFEWHSDLLGTASGWVARIVTALHAGDNTAAQICANAAPVALFSLLSGSPDPGGTWKDPLGAPHSGIFDPLADLQGNWIYSHSVPATCPVSSATLTVTKIDAPDAGTDANLNVCASDAPIPLFAALGGTPDPGGAWTAPGGGAHSGIFDPSVDPPGIYTYTVTGTSPCLTDAATVTVSVNQPPNAGIDGSIAVCSNGAPISLFAQLGGSPDNTGAWTGPGGAPVSGTYTPGTSTPGIYTYTVPGTPPCAADQSTVTVSQTTAPNAGGNRSIAVCSNGIPFSMLAQLLGTPDAGGSWVGPGGAHGDLFTPGVDASGAYTYTVIGTAPCANATATLTITVNQAPNAGANGSVTLCSTSGVYSLFNALVGSPNVGGSWRDPSNNPHSGNFTPGVSPAGVYTYSVTGTAPCTPASATVTVTVNTAPNAGTGANVTRCSNAPNFGLFVQLGGSPNAGGTWTDPIGIAHGNTFDPGVDLPGPYTYTVVGLAPCANATAVVNVSIVEAPDAGLNGGRTVCSNAAPFDLFAELGGTPDANGTWTAPGGGAVGSIFTPGTSTPGIYVYTVPGTSPCANDLATVNVVVVNAPNPGTNGSISVCSNAANVNLFGLLGGSPQVGGTWTKPGGGVHSGTYLPASDPAGNYTYTVAGTTPCTSQSAVVQVSRTIAPNAGTNGSITVCSTNGAFQLINQLGGSPSGTGSWLDPSFAPASGTFTPGTSLPGVYAYVVLGSGPCVNDTGFVAVNVNTAPNAGTNASTTVCDNASAFPLFNLLGGTPMVGGTWTRPDGNSHTGTFTPGLSQTGGYTYTVAGLAPCANATAVVTVSVNHQPNAGTNDSFTRCSTDGPVNMLNELNGNPEPGGAWTGPGGASTGTFVPGTSQPGVYTYSIAGLAPCTNASATLSAFVIQAPNAGGDGTITVCQGNGTVNLFTGITGPYDLGGTWEDLDNTGQLTGNLFNYSGLSPGTYEFRYEVEGFGQCGDDHAHVDVIITAQLDAGNNTNASACSSSTAVNLFNLLSGGPQGGGTWADLDNTGNLAGQFFNASASGAGVYHFRYLLVGSVGCAADSADLTLTVVAAPNPGTSATTTVCSNAGQFSMFALLGGNPQNGGQWRVGAPNGMVHSANYNPAVDNSNTFYYVLNGSPPCSSANSTVTVTEVQAPWAGNDGTTTICSSTAPFSMFNLLTGNPNTGGSWYFNNILHAGGATYTPSQDATGLYEYRVAGQAPCGEDVAVVNVTEVQEANAGCPSSVTVCANSPSFQLFNVLTCDPQTGGFWLGPDLLPHSSSYNPATDDEGDYRYIITGTSPCVNDTGVVSVFETDLVFAGCDAGASYCASAAQPGNTVNLFTLLGCNPDPFGTWVGPEPLNPPSSGFFQPGVSPPGVYTYSVSNTCGSDDAQVTLTVSAPPIAGCNGSATLCSTGTSINMFLLLGCNPQAGGQWSGPAPNYSNVVSNFFQPGVSVPGTYRYRVAGVGACGNADAFVTIVVNQAANAGTGGSHSFCRTSGQINLFNLLGGTPQSGGAFTLGMATVSPILDPASAQSGTYIYTVTGAPPCANAQASLVVTFYDQPDAGNDGSLEMCSSSPIVSLISYLTGAQFGGVWSNPSGAGHSGIYDPVVDGPGLYKYRVNENAGCPADSAYVTVFEYGAVEAGTGGTVQVCESVAPFSLFDHLTGEQTGGTWTDPSGAVVTDIYSPGTSQPGAYKYKLLGTPPCASDSATVTIVESPQADAGISTLANLCSAQAPVPLISLLAGLPDTNGSWTYGGPHGPLFDPQVDLPGPYVYTVLGIAPCSNATAQVVITLTQAASAGSNGSITACVGADPIALLDGLGGSPSPGGSWSTVCGQGELINGIFDPTGMGSGSTCVFTYAQAANGPCVATSAQVALNVVDALDAGIDSSSQACYGQIVDLFAALGGTSQAGGFWLNPDNANGVSGSTWATVGDAIGITYHFDYVLPGGSQCTSDTARVSIELLEGPFAGTNGSGNVCTIATFNMFGALSGGPDAGGQWFSPGWAPHGAVYVPATDDPGIYHYIVGGVGACPADTADVIMSETPAANAGAPAFPVVCSTDTAFNMFALLGPNAQPGGSWVYVTGGNVLHNEVYNPAIDASGIYRYCVQGTGPCPTDCEFVTVTENPAPYAGQNNTATVCSSDSPINMFSFLLNSPQSGGTWVYVTGGDVPHVAFFNPASDLPGVYRYTVTGAAPCAESSALLTVDLFQASNAGTSTTVDACLSQTSIDLFAALGPNAQPGGAWTDGGSGALTGSIFNPSVAGNGSWPCVYTVLGNGPCPNMSATATVVVGSGSSAGNDSTVSVCGSTTSYDLLDALGGTPTLGGTWTDIAGTGASLVNGVLDVSDLPVGGPYQFCYTVIDAGCGNVTACVLLSATTFPIAGTGTSLTLCSNANAVDLFSLLTGAPDPDGTWSGPQSQPHNGLFQPGSDPAGMYTYTVAGDAPCVDATATISITVNDPPDAGANGELLACDTLLALDLFSGLQGTPQAGGSWTDVDGTGGLTGGALNTTGIAPGEYYYRYTVTVAGCGSATALVKVKVVTSVEVLDLTATCNTTDRTYIVTFTLQSGDTSTYEVTGLSGTISAGAPYVFTSDPILTSLSFEAFVQDQYACSVLRITGQSPCDFEDEVFIPETFSPNGDGVNELFLIPGIEGYPANTISIFNRWGALMYEAAGYDNKSVVWDGSSPKAALAGPAPAGTYYYVLELGTGRDPYTGFIYLNR